MNCIALEPFMHFSFCCSLCHQGQIPFVVKQHLGSQLQKQDIGLVCEFSFLFARAVACLRKQSLLHARVPFKSQLLFERHFFSSTFGAGSMAMACYGNGSKSLQYPGEHSMISSNNYILYTIGYTRLVPSQKNALGFCPQPDDYLHVVIGPGSNLIHQWRP